MHNFAMKIKLDDVALFARIAELGNLSAVARERDVPVSQVTRALARLEGVCGVRLLNRSTHGLSLTDEGDTLLAYGRRLMETTEELGSELSGKISGPSGWVRVSASQVMAQAVIAPSLNALYERYPQLHIELLADDRAVDMARDGIDIAIRSGDLRTDTVVARKIGQHSRTLYAAPAYLKKFGTPQHPNDLQAHRLLTSSVSPMLNRWTMDEADAYQAKGYTRTDNSALLMTLTLEGVGITRMIDMAAAPFVKTGQLVAVLQDYFHNPCVPIHAVMLPGRHRLPKVRACVEHWEAWLAALSAGSAA